MTNFWIIFIFGTIHSTEILLFEDHFNTFDLSTWNHEITLGGNGNREFEHYTNNRNNSYVQEGVLFLKPTLTEDTYDQSYVHNGTMDLWGTTPASSCTSPQFNGCQKVANAQVGDILPPIQSAKVETAKSFAFKYGRVEIRAKLPTGKWIWPGMWMMPLEDRYGGWPSSGEIDIMEARGNINYTYKGNPMGNNRFSTCFHFGMAWNKDGYIVAVNETAPLPGNQTYGDDFHTFGLYWSETELYTYIDDPKNIVERVQGYGKKSFWQLGLESKSWDANTTNVYKNAAINAPFDQEMYFIFNVAVGGTSGYTKDGEYIGYFVDDIEGKPWHSSDPFPAAKFYEKKDSWYPSWQQGEDGVSDNAALQIDSIRVWGFEGSSTFTKGRNQEFSYQDFIDAGNKGTLSCTSCSNSTTGTCQNPNDQICYSKIREEDECFVGTSPCSINASTTKVPEEILIFEDEFNKLNFQKWKHEITMDSDFTLYQNSREHSYVQNGTLYLQPSFITKSNNENIDLWGKTFADKCTGNQDSGCVRKSNTNPVHSARLRTAETFSMTYGRVEIRAKLPNGDWLRPSFRLRSRFDSYGRGDLSGEIVFMESSGNDPSHRNEHGQPFGRDTIFSCAKTGIYEQQGGILQENFATLNDSSFDGNFHTFGLYWSPEELYTYLDTEDNVVTKVYDKNQNNVFEIGAQRHLWTEDEIINSPWKQGEANAPFDQPMYLSIGLAAGGNDGFFPDNLNGKAWLDSDEQMVASEKFINGNDSWLPSWVSPALQIDSVKVWAFPKVSAWTYHSDQVPPKNLLFNEKLSTLSLVEPGEEQLLFEDDFETFNLDNWKPENTMMNLNNQWGFQMFVNTRQTSYVNDGVLYLKPMLTTEVLGDQMVHGGWLDMWGTDAASLCTNAMSSGCSRGSGPNNILNPVQSASFRTAETFSFKYGRVEVEAKFPSGAWLWPRVYLLPQHDDYGSWPESGQINFIEGRGNAPNYQHENTSLGSDSVSSGFWINGHEYHGDTLRLENGSFTDGFHTFGLIWNPTELITYVDTPANVLSRQPASHTPFDREFYLSISLAVGGTYSSPVNSNGYFPDDLPGKPWSNKEEFPQKSFLDGKEQWWPSWSTDGQSVDESAAFQIKSVKIWGKKGYSSWRRHRLAGDLDYFNYGGKLHTSNIPPLDPNKKVHVVSVSAKAHNPASNMHELAEQFQQYLALPFGTMVNLWGIQLHHGIITATATMPNLLPKEKWPQNAMFEIIALASLNATSLSQSSPNPTSTDWLLILGSAVVAVLVIYGLLQCCLQCNRRREYDMIPTTQ